ncbi:MAG TPA: potassium channel family protein [Pyrinomonadaceae bacterium]
MSIVSKLKTLNWRESNPLWWSLISWTLTVGGYGTGEILIRLFGWGGLAPEIILPCLVGVAALAPFAALLTLVSGYKRNAQTLKRIVCMYLALVLICANLNFLLMLHFSRGGSPPFHGIHSVWGEYAAGRPLPFSFENAFQSIIDCLHFSVMTLSTVGYGDIYPTAWYSKLIVDLEILMGLGINILTIGRYFSRGEEQ